MNLSGNRRIQKLEVEKRMTRHYKSLSEARSYGCTYWGSDKPQLPKGISKVKIERKAMINHENEKLMTKLYEIQTDDRRHTVSPNKLTTRPNEEHEAFLKKRLKHKKKTLKQHYDMIKEGNRKYQHYLEEVTPLIRSSKQIEEYKTQKKLVATLRKNTTSSQTALHLLTVSPPKPQTRPKSAGYALSESRKLNKFDISGSYDWNTSIPTMDGFSRYQQQQYSSSHVEVFEGKYGDQQEELTSPEATKNGNVSRKLVGSLSTSHHAITLPSSSLRKRRKALLHECEMKSSVTSNSTELNRIINKPAQSLDQSTSAVSELKETQPSLSQSVIQPPSPNVFKAHHIVSESPKFILRFYDVGYIWENINQPEDLDHKATSSKVELLPLSTGILVDGRLLPETEQTKSHEIFLPIPQLQRLAAADSNPAYDSLYRQLKRVKCWNESEGLYASLTTNIGAESQEKLIEIITKNIEFVVDIEAVKVFFKLKTRPSTSSN